MAWPQDSSRCNRVLQNSSQGCRDWVLFFTWTHFINLDKAVNIHLVSTGHGSVSSEEASKEQDLFFPSTVSAEGPRPSKLTASA